ncbi:MAG: aminotransferase class V-fold PLP-dependent enzyme [Chitinophagaceae bacterium]|nr:aminotransferase class V-fold PLP-dependent enzyme [Chitinophagaceae bacterium]
MKRRDILKGITLLPLGGANLLPVQSKAGEPVKIPGSPLAPRPNIFQSIGVEPVINCMGTFTIIGGSLERESVRAAMESASKNFVQYDELAYGIGQRLAELTKAEWGMVSAGCAAGLKHVTAACVTGGNPEKLIRIPDLAGFEKTEVVAGRTARNVYDHAVRNVGVKMITVDTLEEMDKALGPKTAMVYATAHSREPFTVEAIAKLTRAKNIPLLVDAAAEDLTIPCVHLEKGADVVAYSGGKALCGPQCAGILLGRKDILQSAWQASSPHHGPGRDNKVGREEMIGALAAVEAWITFDHKAQWQKWLSYLDTVAKKLAKVESVKTSVRTPTGLGNNSPGLIISWDPLKLNITGEEVAEELGRNKPRIALAAGTKRNAPSEPGLTSINITAGQMQPGEDKIVAERIYGVLTAKRDPKPTTMKAPSSNLSGRWDVAVQYYSSKCNYTWTIEQDGNWLQGVHTGTFSTQNLAGTIEDNVMRVRNNDNPPGDHLTFTFTGNVSGDMISGSVYLVEYGTATFTATKYKYQENRAPLTVPGGPPLAT